MSSSISHHDTRVAPLRQAAVISAMAAPAAPYEAGTQRKAIRLVITRDGRQVPFDRSKIAEAIFKAAQAAGYGGRIMSWILADELAGAVILFLERNCSDGPLYIGDVQDTVEKVLTETGHARVARFVHMSSSNAANPLAGAAVS